MPKLVSPIFRVLFVLGLSLTVTRCGVKLKPRPETIEEGPLSKFEQTPAPKDEKSQ